MKQYRLQIALLLFAFTGILLVELSTPDPLNWTVSFTRTDKIPYGSYLLYEMLHELFPDQEISVTTESAYFTLSDLYNIDGNYIIINSEFYPDEYDVDELLLYASAGNSVFIAAENIAGPLSDSIGMTTNSRFTIFDSTVSYNFTSPSLHTDSGYRFRSNEATWHISSFDTATTTILGTNSRDAPVFIRISYGDGFFFINTLPKSFTNYNISDNENRDYAFKALSYLPVQETIWDEYYKVGRTQVQTKLRVILDNTSLTWAYYIMITGIGLFIFFQARRRQRVIPIIESPKNSTVEFATMIAGLYHQQGSHKNMASKKALYFLEYIRNRYYVRTIDLNNDLAKKISERSGVSPFLIQQIFSRIKTTQAQTAVTEEDLIALNESIETFYNHTK